MYSQFMCGNIPSTYITPKANLFAFYVYLLWLKIRNQYICQRVVCGCHYFCYVTHSRISIHLLLRVSCPECLLSHPSGVLTYTERAGLAPQAAPSPIYAQTCVPSI